MAGGSQMSPLQRRNEDTLKTFLSLVQSPFRQAFSTDAFLASLVSSVGISLLILAAWCLLRPYHSLVYAPKLRHIDEKRAPPPIGKGYFSWIQPLRRCHEKELVGKIGMDATIFLRFMRLCRTLFFFLGLIGCLVVIPVNETCNIKNTRNWDTDQRWFVMLSPTYSWGECMWAHICVAYAFTFIIMFFLWRNYRDVVALKKSYFESPEYLDSLHSRTLLITDIPSSYRSDDGLSKIIGALSLPADGTEKCAIGRNVKELPILLKRHEKAVRCLEQVLAKYLKNPDRLPATRPVCKPDKDDKTMDQQTNVDAIEYYKRRIEELGRRVAIVRKGIDSRDAMPYGFVSFPTVSRAHIAAKASRRKHPKGATIQLASKPQDIIWENLTKGKGARRWNSFIGNLLFILLSVLFVIPNALMAVFLTNFNNISAVFPAFQQVLARDRRFWAVVQGFLAPTVTSIIYLLLPVLMRRLSAWQGDITKSSRERHVTHKLFIFFIINNFIVFTMFSTLWTTVIIFINDGRANGFSWDAVLRVQLGNRVVDALFQVSTFWITYLLQRNLGAILDLVQLVSLIGKSFTVNFLNPTPRQRIEWTAPEGFEYATYYNYFLFYTTIALCFATIQPLVLPVAFFYFLIDTALKKYTLMYVFVTKVESGGTFWRLIFNRILFANALHVCVVSLLVWVKYNGQTALTVFPILPMLLLFKLYCHRTYDVNTRFFTKGADRDSMINSGQFNRKDKLEMRYRHPAIHRRLIRPMVSGKAAHLMGQIYGNNAAQNDGQMGFDMDSMQHGKAGKKAPLAQFEVVQEEDMDFENFKDRAEFGEDLGGGSIYGDGTMTPPPGFGSPASSRPGSPVLGPVRPSSPLAGSVYRGSEYIPVTGTVPPRSPGPFARESMQQRPASLYDYTQSDARSESSVIHLLGGQHPPGAGTPGPYYHPQPQRQYQPLRQPSTEQQQQQTPPWQQQQTQHHHESYEDYRR